MGGEPRTASIWRFGAFEMDGRTGELRRGGIAVKLQDQPAQLLLFLLEHAGEIVTREDLRQTLWAADTFVDFDHALNTATMKLREALGDARERPIYIQTIPRKGYRFVAPASEMPARESRGGEPQGPTTQAVQGVEWPRHPGERLMTAPDHDVGRTEESVTAALPGVAPAGGIPPGLPDKTAKDARTVMRLALGLAAVLFLAVVGALVYRGRDGPVSPVRALTRLTFDEGLQSDPTWSPDGRYLAYSSDRGGTTNIWVQQISVGDPIQVTTGPGPNWQPDWSPDGRYIAYRSDSDDRGIFIIPVLGGAGQERKIVSFGYNPRWSPDSSKILFQTGKFIWALGSRLYVVGLDGAPPREVLRDFLDQGIFRGFLSAAWHPDGKRLTVWANDSRETQSRLNFWTIPLTGGKAIHSPTAPQIEQELAELGVKGGMDGLIVSKLAWAPSGDALYLEGTFRGVGSLWRLNIDAKTLAATGMERLTAGGGLDTGPAVSPDGKRLAFTAASRKLGTWSYPLDANRGKITGIGSAVTSSGVDSWVPALTRDGSKLAFGCVRAGEQRLCVKVLPDGRETPLFVDSFFRDAPQWSPNGKHLVYVRGRREPHESRLMTWSAETRQEEPLTAANFSIAGQIAYDWSPDGKSILVTKTKDLNLRDVAVWQVPIAAAPHAELHERRIISDAGYMLYQAHFSPDGGWIVFEAVKKREPEGPTEKLESRLYVTTSSGGPWISITDGEFWADKPRWSPDGKTIYFLLNRGTFYNVWAIRFDCNTGRTLGHAFQVTSLDSPSLMVPRDTSGAVEISISEKALVLTLGQLSGGIWVMDKVDR